MGYPGGGAGAGSIFGDSVLAGVIPFHGSLPVARQAAALEWHTGFGQCGSHGQPSNQGLPQGGCCAGVLPALGHAHCVAKVLAN